MSDILTKTAWTMVPPRPYGLFHIIFTATGLILAAFSSYWISNKPGQRDTDRVLFGCGILMAVSEIYKQLFLYYVVNGMTYDWWYFPFQLCSIPMYLCLIIAFMPPSGLKRIFYTFLQDFSLLGGIMALAEPSGLMHNYVILTLHGLGWHVLLIFLGLTAGFSQKAGKGPSAYGKTLPLLFTCLCFATVINLSAKPWGQANMFYISPFYPNTQAVFSIIARKAGIVPGNLVYIGSICLGGFLLHLAFSPLFCRD